MEEREKFTFFRSYLDSAKALDTKEEQADFLLAICEYGLNGVLPEQKKGFVAAVFAAVKPNLDTSLAKAKAGSAGGRAKQTEANASNLEAIKNKEDRSMNKEYIKPYSTIEEAFESFWNEYPNRKGKGKAREAFKKAIKKTGISTMVEAVRKQRQGSQWKKDEGRYIPYPATWLNQERWEDEVDGNGSGTGHSEEPGLQRLTDWEQQHTL